ncbi:MAG: hypothetical protein JWO05_3925 [Gemmatimonadetes bacterium]|nr:hypothetical protein [Gemmatimonadota bacterium]
MTPRIVAIDWSGALDGAEQRIWLAETSDRGRVVRLEGGRDRTAIVEHLIQEAHRDPELVVGLDFAFSVPAWFLTDRQLDDAPALWEIVGREGEQWLAKCAPPFWGRPGRGRPNLQEHLRQTEREVPATGGIRPKSVFQIGGAGAVGTGSIRGMPILKQLRAAGFAVWPFDVPRLPMVVEIYPRALTGAVVKGNADERRRYLEHKYTKLPAQVIEVAVRSDDAFDALVSSLVMAEHAMEFTSLPPANDRQQRLEGQIWLPAGARKTETFARGRYNSSKTRVAPVFSALEDRADEDPQWLRRLLSLATAENPRERIWRAQDLIVQSSHYGQRERPLQPPLALLSWLVRNLDAGAAKLKENDASARERRNLAAKDPVTIERALELLRSAGAGRGWHVLEGPTYPDVLLVTPDALVVIEGKRTEAGPTTSTTWMSGRHQMLRHLDAAWEIRGERAVYGLFVVEGKDERGTVPPMWVEAARDTTSEAAIQGSLPHRSPEEREGIVGSFLGVTTWQAIVSAFSLDPRVLAETVSDVSFAGFD